ncbi:MAG TPA: 30S ribosomal protein S3 [Oligoflexus sp.]|uniref:30S ribosomal protein S3 n=1 Tax=Oligoflexus sp. TaxID=1971216 RepID=UPI002D7ECCA1|nr:30S ribosomal protein S3 [Oligoflexus sp.]HET9239514.1 30S ribosomal protein S3 [Oligoflexus sp.]
MGQKVNPIGFRTGITRPWASRWYAKNDYAKFLHEDLRIRDYIMKKFDSAGVSKVEIERAAANMRVNIFSSRPGIIIGKKGAGAESLKDELVKICKLSSGDPNVNVYEIQKPDADANLAAQNIKQQLVRRVSFRRAMKKVIASAIKAGAKGIKVSCSGRLGGADMSRIEKYREGRVPLHTLRADIDYGTAEALTTYGLIGIKVWIYKGDILTDQ